MENFKEERYLAAMLLSAVGDALGFKNGYWEFERNGQNIHYELNQIGGIENVNVELPDWRVSDDTVMHLATAEGLVGHGSSSVDDNLYKRIAHEYQQCMNDMTDREAGLTCMKMCKRLKPSEDEGFRIPFDPRGGGCGAAMRSMCIGLRFPRPEEINDLIAVSVESGRMTHHHPTGYLGSLASALFTSFAVQGKRIQEWGCSLLKSLETAKKYICSSNHDVKENLDTWYYFEEKWNCYLRLRNLLDGNQEAVFVKDDGDVRKRDQLYTWFSFDNWGGASGHDAPMIAYDALLACKGDWAELCNRAMFHGGDSDSTGVIAGCLFGVLYGTQGVSRSNFEFVEYRKRLEDAGKKLYLLADTTECSQTDYKEVKSSGKKNKEAQNGNLAANQAEGNTEEIADKTEGSQTDNKEVKSSGKKNEEAQNGNLAANQAGGNTEEIADKTEGSQTDYEEVKSSGKKNEEAQNGNLAANQAGRDTEETETRTDTATKSAKCDENERVSDVEPEGDA